MTAGVIGAASAEEMLSLIGGGWERSALFRYLREHHDRIVERQAGERMNWSALCGWFMTSGLTNRRGGAPTPSCARKTWYRVRKLVAAQRQKAQEAAERAAQEQAAKEDERRARREAARAEAARSAADAARLRERMNVVQENAAWQREQDRRRREQQEQAAAAREAACVAEAAKAAGALVPPAEGAAHLVTLDLPKVEGVSDRAYLPHDPTLPPVREGEICRATGIRWAVGDDLPGYPSKRNYEYEIDWLRDVGRLLRAKHPNNLTMTREEKYVIRTAQSRIPNLFY